MKKVVNTKFYSVKQMENMSFNLREKFNNYCSIGYKVELNAHASTKEINTYKQFYIYICPKHTYSKSWLELQQKYHELMRW
jgi:hypothetical protein